VLTERKDHLQAIAERLSRFAKNVIVLKGGMKAKERSQATEALRAVPDGEERVIVATGRYLGEGFDDARLDTLFLTMPISWRGTLAQYAGRPAARHKLSTIYPDRSFAVAGGLVSYAADGIAAIQQTGYIYAAQILKGANPADLPVRQPTKFKLVINVSTAKALNLYILATADEVIQ
jgi:hypothetical protein